MACTHIASMAILARIEGGFAGERRIGLFASAAARLMRTYVAQVEAFRHLRQGGSQFMRVEHVHVNEGGQALIGNVRRESSDGGEGENVTLGGVDEGGGERGGEGEETGGWGGGGGEPRALCSFIPFAPLPGEKVRKYQ